MAIFLLVAFKNSMNLCLKLNPNLYQLTYYFINALPKNAGKWLTHLCCVVTKGHTYFVKAVGKSSKSPKGEVFLKEFFNKFEDIGK